MFDPMIAQMSSTVGICLLMAIAMIIVAKRSISFRAATAFAISFAAIGITWAQAMLLPPASIMTGIGFVTVNLTGACGMAAMWCGFWLRSGRRISWWFINCLILGWLAPVLAVEAFALAPGSYMPFAVSSIVIGLVSSSWVLLKKNGRHNIGDLALVSSALIALPVASYAFWIGTTQSDTNPVAAWGLYLSFLPVLLSGVGLFALLSFTLDAITESEALARTDGLTGLLNRRAFDEELTKVHARAERYQRDLSLILLDIDNFKELNDDHGHPAGDAALKRVARVLEDGSRQIDAIARIGGEEFAVILADTPSSAAIQLAERLRHEISIAGNDAQPFTASFGVASASGEDFQSGAMALLREADKALYAAKRAGRDRVESPEGSDRPSALGLNEVPGLETG
ncbi:MAG: GGDEF domain-containing protein [Pseudomonadota bacterium]